jgi:hypothetical protein
MKSIVSGIVSFSFAFSVLCQEHPYSNAYAYYTTTVTADGQFSATTVAGTGGTATHTMVQVAIFVQSPSGRTASAYDYPSGTLGQATTYLSLCGNGLCEDGDFFATTVNTTENCGQTGQNLTVPVQSGNTAVNPWIRWTSSAFSPTEVQRKEGPSTFTATAQRSTNCVGATASFGAQGPPGLSSEFTPIQPPNQTLAFSGTIGSGIWHWRTTNVNNVGGLVTGGAGFEATSCTIHGSPGTSATVTVQ